MPSAHSAFSRLPALEDDEEEDDMRVSSRQRLFGGLAEGGYSSAGLRYPPGHLSPVEALQARQRGLMERSSLLEETDEETTLQEDDIVKRFHSRRASLSGHPLAHRGSGACGLFLGRWDFKTRAMPLPVGRVSPLTSDNEHGGSGGAAVTGHKNHSELGSLEDRVSSGTPPGKSSSVRSQSPRKPEKLQPREAEEDGKREGAAEGDGEEESESGESGEEEEGEGGSDTLQWEEGDVDNENGAKAVHMDDLRPPGPSAPNPLPSFQKQSSTSAKTSSSTPNSLTRPKHNVLPSQARRRTPSVPALPTTLFASTDSATLAALPECLTDYECTLHNSRNYVKEFKALAESGSSDPESDPEPSLTTQMRAARMMEQISTAAKLPALINHHLVTLHKDTEQSDLGFSLSDGFGEPGVYVKSIHSGGLAELDGQLQQYDRIMKVCAFVHKNYRCVSHQQTKDVDAPFLPPLLTPSHYYTFVQSKMWIIWKHPSSHLSLPLSLLDQRCGGTRLRLLQSSSSPATVERRCHSADCQKHTLEPTSTAPDVSPAGCLSWWKVSVFMSCWSGLVYAHAYSNGALQLGLNACLGSRG